MLLKLSFAACQVIGWNVHASEVSAG